MDIPNPVRTPSPARGTPRHVETAAEARQGPLGRPVLYVLVGGLILAAVFVIVSQIWSVSEDLPEMGTQMDAATPAVTPEPAVTPAPTPTPAPAITP